MNNIFKKFNNPNTSSQDNEQCVQNDEMNELKSQIIALRNDFETKFQELKSENEYLRSELNKEKNLIIQKTTLNIRKIEKIINHLNKYYPFECLPENAQLKMGQIRYPRNKDEEILKDYGWLMAPFLYGHSVLPSRFPNINIEGKFTGAIGFNLFCINIFNEYYSNSIFGDIFSKKFFITNDKNSNEYKYNILLKKFFGDCIHMFYYSNRIEYGGFNDNTINYLGNSNISFHTIDDFDTLIMSEMNMLHYIFNKINVYLEYFTCVIKEKEPTFEI